MLRHVDLQIDRRFVEAYRLHGHGQAVQVFLNCLTLMMKAIRSLETSVANYGPIRRNVPEHFGPQQRHCESLVSPAAVAVV